MSKFERNRPRNNRENRDRKKIVKKISAFPTGTNRIVDEEAVANLCYIYAMLSMSMVRTNER